MIMLCLVVVVLSKQQDELKSDPLVTLQIPGEKLSPNNMTGVYIEEPSVLVKNHTEGSQTWTMDKLNCRLDDMV